MANKRITKKTTPPAQRIEVQAHIDPQEMLFIMQQVSNAHMMRDQLKKQKAAQAKAAAAQQQKQQQQQQGGVPATPGAPANAGQSLTQQRRGIRGVAALIGRLPGGKRSAGRTVAGRIQNNLADLPVLPFLIVAVVLALVIMPVSQGYTRLDLLFMVLSGDAKIPIPVRGSGQNYQQALASPPDTSNGGGIGGAWWQVVQGITGLSNTGTDTSAVDNTPPAAQTLNYPGGTQWVD